MTPGSLWRHIAIIRFYVRGTQNHAYIFYNARFATARFRSSLANFDLHVLMYKKQLINVILGVKYDVPSIVTSETPRGYSYTLVHGAPSFLRSHNPRYIMLKSLNEVFFIRIGVVAYVSVKSNI